MLFSTGVSERNTAILLYTSKNMELVLFTFISFACIPSINKQNEDTIILPAVCCVAVIECFKLVAFIKRFIYLQIFN